MPNIIITGGCGFIGSRLAGVLLNAGLYNIRIVDNFSVGSPIELEAQTRVPIQAPSGVEDLDWSRSIQVLKGDIRDKELMLKVSHDCDAVVHLAANTGVAPSVLDPQSDCLTNVVGTLHMLECCRLNGIKKFVFASSGAPLGEQLPPLNEQSVPMPASPYGASKLAGEGYCSAYYKSFAINTIALRFGNVFGPGSVHKGSVVAKFIKMALGGNSIEIYGDGSQTRDFIYIDDLIEAIILAVESEEIGGEIFQIATASETSVNELIKLLRDVFRNNDLKFSDVKYSEKRAGDVHRNYSDTTKAREKLGWKSNTNLTYGLEKTLNYFIKTGIEI